MSTLTTLGSTLEICSLPGLTGSCSELVDRYYYNGNECTYFTYSGCGGNENNFQSFSFCESICMDMVSTSSSDEDVTGYHIAGFIMIFIVVVLFCVLYYLSMRNAHDRFEAHQYKETPKKDPHNKYNKRECLYVSNIAKRVIQSDIKQLFNDYGEIIEFEFRETRGDQLNICFVEFKSVDDANRAIGELNGFNIEGHMLCIKPANEYDPNPNKPTPQTAPKKLKKLPKPPPKSKTRPSQVHITTEKTTQLIDKASSSTDSDHEEKEHKVEETRSRVSGKAKQSISELQTGHFRNISAIVKMETNSMDAKMDVNAIIAKKKSYIDDNPVSGNSGSPTRENLMSMSMNQIDSDFEDYGDEDDDIHPLSDSDMIKFGSHLEKDQMSALKHFVKRRLTISEDTTDREYNWNKIDEEDIANDYVGIDIQDDYDD